MMRLLRQLMQWKLLHHTRNLMLSESLNVKELWDIWFLNFARFMRRHILIHVYTANFFTFCCLIFLKTKLWCTVWLNSKIRNGYQIRISRKTILSFHHSSSISLCLVKLVTGTKFTSGLEFFKVCYMKIDRKERVNSRLHQLEQLLLVCQHPQLLRHHPVETLEQSL